MTHYMMLSGTIYATVPDQNTTTTNWCGIKLH